MALHAGPSAPRIAGSRSFAAALHSVSAPSRHHKLATQPYTLAHFPTAGRRGPERAAITGQGAAAFCPVRATPSDLVRSLPSEGREERGVGALGARPAQSMALINYGAEQ
ncbi:hypothetical protein EYF80_049410 [Liparis tanakae]|uniref:Uncharacterized protein n=1 Tax=Liparis tanakae TaxID=230148 RepID=A0A4Z2FI32_9TELE|nr:hypothetical protein EYF80_049410 [Liparis tanakae]